MRGHEAEPGEVYYTADVVLGEPVVRGFTVLLERQTRRSVYIRYVDGQGEVERLDLTHGTNPVLENAGVTVWAGVEAAIDLYQAAAHRNYKQASLYNQTAEEQERKAGKLKALAVKLEQESVERAERIRQALKLEGEGKQ